MTEQPQTKPRVWRAKAKDWRVLIYKGIDDLGNIQFSTVGQFTTKSAAYKALRMLGN